MLAVVFVDFAVVIYLVKQIARRARQYALSRLLVYLLKGEEPVSVLCAFFILVSVDWPWFSGRHGQLARKCVSAGDKYTNAHAWAGSELGG